MKGSIGGPSRYEDVNELLHFYLAAIVPILGGNLTGVYLTGSLSYRAFNYETGDIDVTVIVNRPVSTDELAALRRLHTLMEEGFPKWARRLECTYTPITMLSSLLPPREPRPWYWGGEGILYEAAPYGNEWIINNYFLYEHAIALRGPQFRELRSPVDIRDAQKACLRDLFKEWVPKKDDGDWFRNSHYASYFVLNLCRILCAVIGGRAESKKTAAAWVKRRYGDRWKGLVEQAEHWHYGVELDLRDGAAEFLEFVIDEVSKTSLYRQLIDDGDDLGRVPE